MPGRLGNVEIGRAELGVPGGSVDGRAAVSPRALDLSGGRVTRNLASLKAPPRSGRRRACPVQGRAVSTFSVLAGG